MAPQGSRGRTDSYQTCGEQTLRGSYLFATHGWNIVGGLRNRKPSLKASISTEMGLVSPFATVSINGTIIHSSGSEGTYTVEQEPYWHASHLPEAASFDIFVEHERQAALDDPDRLRQHSV